MMGVNLVERPVGRALELASTATGIFPRVARSSGWAERRLDLADYYQGLGQAPPKTQLYVPGLDESIDAAVAQAKHDHELFLAKLQHPEAGPDFRAAFHEDVLERLVDGPPGPAVQQQEIELMLQLQRARDGDPARIAAWFGNGAGLDWNDAVMGALTKGMTRSDVQRGQLLLDDAFDLGHEAVHAAKDKWARPRPYVASTELEPSGYKKIDEGSFPSGHTANMVDMAYVNATIDPANAALYMRAAHQMAAARVVGGNHFPSDVVAGAYIGMRAGLLTVHRNPELVNLLRGHVAQRTPLVANREALANPGVLAAARPAVSLDGRERHHPVSE